MDSLRGQIAVVTGGGRGLGKAFAQALANAGATVVLVARSAKEVETTVAEIAATGGTALAAPLDITDWQAVSQLVDRIEHQVGPIDIMINNAGVVSPLGPLWETDPEEWWRSIEVNLRGTLLGTRAVLGGMIARRRGRIINLASLAGTGPIPYGSSYVTSKTAIIRFTETIAAEVEGHGVTVFSIHPGNVRTAMSEYLLNSVPGQTWLPWFQSIFDEGHDTPIAHSIQLVLRLARGDADMLSGRFISVDDDLDRLIRRAPEIVSEQRYVLRIAEVTENGAAEHNA